MSLFAHSYEYQRSFARLREEFSAPSRTRTEPAAPGEGETRRPKSVPDSGGQREVFVRNKAHNVIPPQVVGGSPLMQYDAKAWGRFLDSKRMK